LAVAERPPQGGHVDPKIALLNKGARPDARNENFFADQRTGVFDKHFQDFKGPAAKPQRLFAFQQELPRRRQAKRAKCESTGGRWARSIQHLNLV
jgi:hypothetical protein